LDRLETSGLGLKIGNISVSNTSCADEIVLISEIPDEAQTLVNMATDFAFMEGYKLQPTKSVVITPTVISPTLITLTVITPTLIPYCIIISYLIATPNNYRIIALSGY
jgi:hypothetical protein